MSFALLDDGVRVGDLILRCVSLGSWAEVNSQPRRPVCELPSNQIQSPAQAQSNENQPNPSPKLSTHKIRPVPIDPNPPPNLSAQQPWTRVQTTKRGELSPFQNYQGEILHQQVPILISRLAQCFRRGVFPGVFVAGGSGGGAGRQYVPLGEHRNLRGNPHRDRSHPTLTNFTSLYRRFEGRFKLVSVLPKFRVEGSTGVGRSRAQRPGGSMEGGRSEDGGRRLMGYHGKRKADFGGGGKVMVVKRIYVEFG
ncbi:hypothetical protein Salat_1707600 [Sesamum alatum]|uniref:Uncharacterized protein n=1 Tax=Sesamum alatum TaxID=300844 RepID=A0AAE1Y7X4_9LAMI|nr:hypothetical protein Salat_1707600 [Sesamum alatum]